MLRGYDRLKVKLRLEFGFLTCEGNLAKLSHSHVGGVIGGCNLQPLCFIELLVLLDAVQNWLLPMGAATLGQLNALAAMTVSRPDFFFLGFS